MTMTEAQRIAVARFIEASKRAHHASMEAIAANNDREAAAEELVEAFRASWTPEVILMDGEVVHINRALLEVDGGGNPYAYAVRLITDISRGDA